MRISNSKSPVIKSLEIVLLLVLFLLFTSFFFIRDAGSDSSWTGSRANLTTTSPASISKANPKNMSTEQHGINPGILLLILPEDDLKPYYQPWVEKAPMQWHRAYLSAGAVNEKIYAIGGFIPWTTGGIKPTGAVEEYEPETNQWGWKESLPVEYAYLSNGVVVNNRIYAIGGYPPYTNYSVGEYDPVTDTWVAKAPMPTNREGLGVGVVGGKIYAIGGSVRNNENEYVYFDTVEQYDPETDLWTSKKSMPTPRGSLSVAVVSDKIYAIGGYDESGPSDVVEEYDPATDSWSSKTKMPTKRYYLSSTAVNGKIYSIGGSYYRGADTPPLNNVERYDPLTDSWTTKSPMPMPLHSFAIAVANNKIFVIGGVYGEAGNFLSYALQSNVYEYDPSLDP